MNEVLPPGRTERYRACADEGAPGEVTQAQLDELHIALVAPEGE